MCIHGQWTSPLILRASQQQTRSSPVYRNDQIRHVGLANEMYQLLMVVVADMFAWMGLTLKQCCPLVATYPLTAYMGSMRTGLHKVTGRIPHRNCSQRPVMNTHILQVKQCFFQNCANKTIIIKCSQRRILAAMYQSPCIASFK